MGVALACAAAVPVGCSSTVRHRDATSEAVGYDVESERSAEHLGVIDRAASPDASDVNPAPPDLPGDGGVSRDLDANIDASGAPDATPECGAPPLPANAPGIPAPGVDASCPVGTLWCHPTDYGASCGGDRLSNPQRCGACFAFCHDDPFSTATCRGGRCERRCREPDADCDCDPTTACDVDTWADPANCGGCGRTCAPGESCAAGRCLRVEPRLLSPISALRTLARRPWFRWELPAGADGARLEVCSMRACDRVEHTWDATGASFRPPTALAQGVHFWRITARRGAALDATPSIPWEVWIGPPPPAARSAAAMLDLDGDGAEDPADDLLHPRPSAEYFRERRQGYVYSYSPPFALGDLNGDGFGEVAFLEYSFNLGLTANDSQDIVLLLYRGGPRGAWRVPVAVEVAGACGYPGPSPELVAALPAGDRDGDGYGDALVHYPSMCTSRSFLLPLYGGLGHVLAGSYDRLSSPIIGWIGHGDFDADGREDLVTSCATNARCGELLDVWPGARDRATHERRLVVECSAPGTAGVVWFSDREVTDHNDDGYDDLRRLARSPIVGALLPGGARGLDGARCTHLP